MQPAAVPCLLTGLALASAGSAQSVVSPAHFRAAEASYWDNQGVASTTPLSRHLQIHDDLQGTARTVRGLAFRRDGYVAAGQDYPAWSILCDIVVSTARTTSAAPDAVFDNNHGADRTQVATFKLVQFPATRPGHLPCAFQYVLPFNQPFQFGGGGPLCWEIRTQSNTNQTGVYLDACTASDANPQAAVWHNGTGCTATGEASSMAIYGNSQPNWPQGSMLLTLTGQFLPRTAVVFLSIGVSDSNFGGLPLPFELPGTAAAPSGPCTVYNDSILQVPQLTDANGQMNASLPVPALATLNGAYLFSQVLALDAAANNWGTVLSNSAQHQLVAPYGQVPVGDVYLSGNVGPTGTPRPNFGLVTRID